VPAYGFAPVLQALACPGASYEAVRGALAAAAGRLRERRETAMLVQALQLAGSLHMSRALLALQQRRDGGPLATPDTAAAAAAAATARRMLGAAAASWRDGLDACFGSLDVIRSWRAVLAAVGSVASRLQQLQAAEEDDGGEADDEAAAGAPGGEAGEEDAETAALAAAAARGVSRAARAAGRAQGSEPDGEGGAEQAGGAEGAATSGAQAQPAASARSRSHAACAAAQLPPAVAAAAGAFAALLRHHGAAGCLLPAVLAQRLVAASQAAAAIADSCEGASGDDGGGAGAVPAGARAAPAPGSRPADAAAGVLPQRQALQLHLLTAACVRATFHAAPLHHPAASHAFSRHRPQVWLPGLDALAEAGLAGGGAASVMAALRSAICGLLPYGAAFAERALPLCVAYEHLAVHRAATDAPCVADARLLRCAAQTAVGDVEGAADTLSQLLRGEGLPLQASAAPAPWAPAAFLDLGAGSSAAGASGAVADPVAAAAQPAHPAVGGKAGAAPVASGGAPAPAKGKEAAGAGAAAGKGLAAAAGSPADAGAEASLPAASVPDSARAWLPRHPSTLPRWHNHLPPWHPLNRAACSWLAAPPTDPRLALPPALAQALGPLLVARTHLARAALGRRIAEAGRSAASIAGAAAAGGASTLGARDGHSLLVAALRRGQAGSGVAGGDIGGGEEAAAAGLSPEQLCWPGAVTPAAAAAAAAASGRALTGPGPAVAAAGTKAPAPAAASGKAAAAPAAPAAGDAAAAPLQLAAAPGLAPGVAALRALLPGADGAPVYADADWSWRLQLLAGARLAAAHAARTVDPSAAFMSLPGAALTAAAAAPAEQPAPPPAADGSTAVAGGKPAPAGAAAPKPAAAATGGKLASGRDAQQPQQQGPLPAAAPPLAVRCAPLAAPRPTHLLLSECFAELAALAGEAWDARGMLVAATEALAHARLGAGLPLPDAWGQGSGLGAAAAGVPAPALLAALTSGSQHDTEDACGPAAGGVPGWLGLRATAATALLRLGNPAEAAAVVRLGLYEAEAAGEEVCRRRLLLLHAACLRAAGEVPACLEALARAIVPCLAGMRGDAPLACSAASVAGGAYDLLGLEDGQTLAAALAADAGIKGELEAAGVLPPEPAEGEDGDSAAGADAAAAAAAAAARARDFPLAAQLAPLLQLEAHLWRHPALRAFLRRSLPPALLAAVQAPSARAGVRGLRALAVAEALLRQRALALGADMGPLDQRCDALLHPETLRGAAAGGSPGADEAEAEPCSAPGPVNLAACLPQACAPRTSLYLPADVVLGLARVRSAVARAATLAAPADALTAGPAALAGSRAAAAFACRTAAQAVGVLSALGAAAASPLDCAAGLLQYGRSVSRWCAIAARGLQLAAGRAGSGAAHAAHGLLDPCLAASELALQTATELSGRIAVLSPPVLRLLQQQPQAALAAAPTVARGGASALALRQQCLAALAAHYQMHARAAASAPAAVAAPLAGKLAVATLLAGTASAAVRGWREGAALDEGLRTALEAGEAAAWGSVTWPTAGGRGASGSGDAAPATAAAGKLPAGGKAAADSEASRGAAAASAATDALDLVAAVAAPARQHGLLVPLEAPYQRLVDGAGLPPGVAADLRAGQLAEAAAAAAMLAAVASSPASDSVTARAAAGPAGGTAVGAPAGAAGAPQRVVLSPSPAPLARQLLAAVSIQDALAGTWRFSPCATSALADEAALLAQTALWTAAGVGSPASSNASLGAGAAIAAPATDGSSAARLLWERRFGLGITDEPAATGPGAVPLPVGLLPPLRDLLTAVGQACGREGGSAAVAVHGTACTPSSSGPLLECTCLALQANHHPPAVPGIGLPAPPAGSAMSAAGLLRGLQGVTAALFLSPDDDAGAAAFAAEAAAKGRSSCDGLQLVQLAVGPAAVTPAPAAGPAPRDTAPREVLVLRLALPAADAALATEALGIAAHALGQVLDPRLVRAAEALSASLAPPRGIAGTATEALVAVPASAGAAGKTATGKGKPADKAATGAAATDAAALHPAPLPLLLERQAVAAEQAFQRATSTFAQMVDPLAAQHGATGASPAMKGARAGGLDAGRLHRFLAACAALEDPAAVSATVSGDGSAGSTAGAAPAAAGAPGKKVGDAGAPKPAKGGAPQAAAGLTSDAAPVPPLSARRRPLSVFEAPAAAQRGGGQWSVAAFAQQDSQQAPVAAAAAVSRLRQESALPTLVARPRAGSIDSTAGPTAPQQAHLLTSAAGVAEGLLQLLRGPGGVVGSPVVSEGLRLLLQSQVSAALER
jgi:hypothetical protein